QIRFDAFRQRRGFLLGSIAGCARELLLFEVRALKPYLFRRGRSPDACCQDKHTRAQALPVIIYGRPSPLFPDFLAQLDRRKHISARRAERYGQFIDVWTDGPNQLNGLTRHSVVHLPLISTLPTRASRSK